MKRNRMLTWNALHLGYDGENTECFTQNALHLGYDGEK